MKTINSFFSNKILSEEKIEFDNKGRAKGYFALALDAKSKNELKKYVEQILEKKVEQSKRLPNEALAERNRP